MEASYTLWLVYVSLASFVLCKVFVLGKKNSRLPPGPTPIPLLGNIFDIQGDLHQALARLAGVHGPIISIKLGATTAVVASSVVGMAMAAEAPAPSPDTGAATTTPAFAVGTLVAAAVGYLFC